MVAVLDACVLYPPSIRDIFMWLAVETVYRPRWTDAIHDEWMRSVLVDRPDLRRSQLQHTRRLMDDIDPFSLVSGYEKHIASVNLPDPDDRHVVAAGIATGASVIVTFNLSDFPQTALAPHGLRAVHPDDFIVSLLKEHPEGCLSALRKHRASLCRPRKTAEEYRRRYVAAVSRCLHRNWRSKASRPSFEATDRRPQSAQGSREIRRNLPIARTRSP